MSYEKELKLLLNKEDYSFFVNSFQEITNPLNQINYYFDTNEFSLNQLGVTLRIREENERNLLLCLKTKLNDLLSDITISNELEKNISRTDFNQYQKNPEEIITYLNNEIPVSIKKKLENNQLQLLGSIKNQRRKLLFNEYICDLDYTIYPNGEVFYEMEFEGMESELDSEKIMQYLDINEIKYTVNKKSKYKRFVECIVNN
ncbi:CYTH domain-containing protein (plasmid) [Lysinibacillus sp. fkY74-1]